MAGRIRISQSISWSNENVSVGFSTSAAADQSGTEAIGNNQIIGASSEALVFGDVTTIGFLALKNMNADGGADIHIGVTNPATSTDKVVTLSPGRGVIIEDPPAVTWYAISATGNSNLFVVAIEA
jgi:hypothetical protein